MLVSDKTGSWSISGREYGTVQATVFSSEEILLFPFETVVHVMAADGGQCLWLLGVLIVKNKNLTKNIS